MKRVICYSFCLSLTMLSIGYVYAQDNDKLLPIGIYAKAWMQTNSDARLKLIKTIWSNESTYEDPAATVKGPEDLNKMIDNFYRDFPGSTFEGDPVISKDNHFTWSWRIIDARKNLMLAGRDYVETDGKGHILKLVGFWEPKNSVDANLKAVTAYYNCLFKTGDFKTMATLIAEGAVYNQAEGLPYGGTYIGFSNWIKMFTQAGSLFDLAIEKEPIYFSNLEKDGIIIRFTIKCTAKKSGKIISMPIAEHFELSDGKITAIRPFYFDTQKFVDFLQ